MIRHLLAFALLALVELASADSWQYDAAEENRSETFGDTRIVQTTDARANQQFPEFVLSVYYKDELRAKYRGVGVEKIFPSPDNTRFLGLSNRGLPGTAIVLFDNEGRLLLEVKHGLAAFDYCAESITLVRRWFDEDKPDVKFVPNPKSGGYKAITLRGCKGNTGDLMDFVLAAYAKSYQGLLRDQAAQRP